MENNNNIKNNKIEKEEPKDDMDIINLDSSSSIPSARFNQKNDNNN